MKLIAIVLIFDPLQNTSSICKRFYDGRLWSSKQNSWFGEPGHVYRNDLTMNISDCALTRQQRVDGIISFYIILSICGILFATSLYHLITACHEDCRL